MGFHILSTDIGLHDLLPMACASPQINSVLQTSITLKAVQVPPSSRPPPSLVPSRHQHFLLSAPLPQTFRVRLESRSDTLGHQPWERGESPKSRAGTGWTGGGCGLP